MHIVYIDEAGNTGNNLLDPCQPIHLVVGLMVRQDKWKDVENDFEINFRQLFRSKYRVECEFHGIDIFQGKGFFGKLKLTERITVYENILNLLNSYDLSLIFAGIDKKN